jgi:cell division protein FtsB
MAPFLSGVRLSRRVRRWLIAGAVLVLMVWLTFFDSHSLLRRAQWHHEMSTLRAENEQLQARIDELEQKLQETSSDEVVEQIAREQYGMRRRGETVYRVEHQK